MSAGHTPGPWGISNILRGKYAGARGIAPIAGPSLCILPAGRDDVQLANAHLIAGSPVLLSAAVDAVSLLETVAPYHPQTAALRAAIATAKGGAS